MANSHMKEINKRHIKILFWSDVILAKAGIQRDIRLDSLRVVDRIKCGMTNQRIFK